MVVEAAAGSGIPGSWRCIARGGEHGPAGSGQQHHGGLQRAADPNWDCGWWSLWPRCGDHRHLGPGGRPDGRNCRLRSTGSAGRDHGDRDRPGGTSC